MAMKRRLHQNLHQKSAEASSVKPRRLRRNQRSLCAKIFYGTTEEDAPELDEPAVVSPKSRFCLSPGKARLTSERPSPFCASTTSQPAFDFSRCSTLTVARARVEVLSLML